MPWGKIVFHEPLEKLTYSTHRQTNEHVVVIQNFLLFILLFAYFFSWFVLSTNVMQYGAINLSFFLFQSS